MTNETELLGEILGALNAANELAAVTMWGTWVLVGALVGVVLLRGLDRTTFGS